MATLPRRQSGNKLPEYKDYVNFVSAYRNGKKEEDGADGQPIVLTINTRINCPESISHGRTCESYSEFLGKTKHKKFGPVKPPICNRETTNAPAKKTVKTEIFLEINNDSVDNGSCQTNNYSVGKAIKQFENHNGHNTELKRTQSSSSVEAKKKLFEEKTTNKNQLTRVSSPFQQNSVQGIKSNLNYLSNKPANSSNVESPNKEVVNGNKKIFDQLNRENHPLPDKITRVTPPPIFTKKNIDVSFNSVDSDDYREITNVFLTRERAANEDAQRSNMNSHSESCKLNNIRENLIQQLSKTINKTELIEEQENKISVEKIDQVERVPVINVGVINSGIPPPPPPMPVSFSEPVIARMLRISPTTGIQKQTKDQPTQKKHSSQTATLQNANVVEGQTVPNNRKYSTLDRKDPLVRKLAYNAMLDMYGAYHDKANNYVAALPQHQVKKENGLQKIIDNIAAQGGLEKLSGRSNPKAENE